MINIPKDEVFILKKAFPKINIDAYVEVTADDFSRVEDNNEVTDETKPSLSNIFHNRLFTSAISIVFSLKLAKNLTGHDKENHKRKEKEDLYSSINFQH